MDENKKQKGEKFPSGSSKQKNVLLKHWKFFLFSFVIIILIVFFGWQFQPEIPIPLIGKITPNKDLGKAPESLAGNLLAEIKANQEIFISMIPENNKVLHDVKNNPGPFLMSIIGPEKNRFDAVYNSSFDHLDALPATLRTDIIEYYQNLEAADRLKNSVKLSIQNYIQPHPLASRENVLRLLEDFSNTLSTISYMGDIVQGEIMFIYEIFPYGKADKQQQKEAISRISKYLGNKESGAVFALEDIVKQTDVQGISATYLLLKHGATIVRPILTSQFRR